MKRHIPSLQLLHPRSASRGLLRTLSPFSQCATKPALLSLLTPSRHLTPAGGKGTTQLFPPVALLPAELPALLLRFKRD